MYIFIGLNIVRALSIIALLLVFSSSIFTLVNDVEAANAFMAAKKAGNATETSDMVDCDYVEGSTVPNQPAGEFWAVLNRLLIIFQVIILILSEIGWPMKAFDKWFPVLGSNFGVGALGVIQCLIGAAVLSHHVDDFSLVSAFFLFALGCLNIAIGLIFRASVKTRRSITSWKERAKDVLPPPVAGLMSPPAASFMSSVFSTEKQPERPMSPEEVLATRPGFGFGRQGEKKAALKGFLLQRPVESLPRYAPKPTSESGHADEKD
ncbi:hypothetical protein GLOTRDRAFT_60670 [Gloeophyllum trabeum ATCC 11539]|uniref:DUF7598 domain-containing protein n=1 Tax=Gloeophyllum trabeum (strain ATCC 11539 / FP-39264 / Madison 617) TaxID=670483 RepID=S7RS60_GLOTA|nr:uncharacterized protein GLOTRDRAFT_60670 [Gloeophyllum trabeum ATCC 11539]EPQ55864.1 hypothetical protein GLOTRDRAFT_60670 [Gloeophyllum trabeum ATCC 11539]